MSESPNEPKQVPPRPPGTLILGPAGGQTLTLGPGGAPGAPAATAAWRPGDVIGGLLEVQSVLGEGGFGSVYKVYHRGWDLEMAVKAPRADRVSSRAAAEAFVQEANTWVGLGLHPHIVTCYFVRLLGLPRIFIEYLEGGSLADWLKARKVREGKVALDIAIQVCRALKYAHFKGLVHRDLKPGNCLMTPGGTVKVTDFGLAKISELEPEAEVQSGAKIARVKGATATGRLGTPEYMAPEQWDKPREAGRAADLWAFGAMLYELCLAKKPFAQADDEPVDSFYARLLTGNWAYAKPAGLPPKLTDLIMACLSVDAAKRPLDFGKVGMELEALYEKVAGSKYAREAAKPVPLADTLNNQGVSLADLGRANEALGLFEAALKLDPTHPGALFNRAVARKRTDTDLLSLLAQAKNARPNDWSAPYLLGLIHLRREDAASATREFDAAQALSRHHRNPLVSQARSRAEAREFSAPLELFVALPTGSEGAVMEQTAFKTLLARAERDFAEGRYIQAQETVFKARTVKGYERAVEAMEFSRRLAVKGTRLALRGAWQRQTFNGSAGAMSVTVSAGGSLCTGHEGNVLKRWEPATGAFLGTAKGGGTPVVRCLTPDKRFAAEASGRMLRIVEQAPGARAVEFESDSEIAAVALSPEGGVAYAAGAAGLRAWELDWEYALKDQDRAEPVPLPELPSRARDGERSLELLDRSAWRSEGGTRDGFRVKSWLSAIASGLCGVGAIMTVGEGIGVLPSNLGEFLAGVAAGVFSAALSAVMALGSFRWHQRAKGLPVAPLQELFTWRACRYVFGLTLGFLLLIAMVSFWVLFVRASRNEKRMTEPHVLRMPIEVPPAVGLETPQPSLAIDPPRDRSLSYLQNANEGELSFDGRLRPADERSTRERQGREQAMQVERRRQEQTSQAELPKSGAVFQAGHSGGKSIPRSVLRRYIEAEKDARKIIELNPKSARAWTSLAYALLRQGRYREADEAATRAIALDPNDAFAYRIRTEVAEAGDGLEDGPL